MNRVDPLPQSAPAKKPTISDDHQSKGSQTVMLLGTISMVSFVFHLIWEYAQCVPFFLHGDLDPTDLGMVKAALGDVIITWIAYVIVAIGSGSRHWILERWRKIHWMSLIAAALVLSFIVEGHASKMGLWKYTDVAPLLFGKISIIPILQLLILFPLSFLLAKKLSRSKRLPCTGEDQS